MASRCCFYILDRDEPNNSAALYPATPMGQLGLVLDEVPQVGDLIALSGQTVDPNDDEQSIQVAGVWRVLGRQWSPAAFGAMSWQSGRQQPEPVVVDVMLEPAPGMFAAVHYAASAPISR